MSCRVTQKVGILHVKHECIADTVGASIYAALKEIELQKVQVGLKL
jgi:hypothetical protein